MHEFPVWLLTLTSHLRTLFVAFLDACVHFFTAYLICIDYTVDKFAAIFGDDSPDYFMYWCEGSLNLERQVDTQYYDDTIPYVASAAYVFQTARFMVIIWFLAFLLPFSHLVTPSATNEYLLFACILFSVFAAYGRISGLATDATSAVEAIGQEIRQQTSRQLAVCLYHRDAAVEYVMTVASFEELLGIAAIEIEATYEADDVLFEEALTSTVLHSLQASIYEEVGAEFLDVTFEELEDSEAQADELIEGFED